MTLVRALCEYLEGEIGIIVVNGYDKRLTDQVGILKMHVKPQAEKRERAHVTILLVITCNYL